MKKNKTAEIIPAIKIPYSQSQVYTYSIPSSLEGMIKIGWLVEIPFRRREIKGVVKKINSSDQKKSAQNLNIKLKAILGLDGSEVVLSKTQIELAEFIAEYYHTPLSLVVKTILPPITKNAPRKKIEFSFPKEVSASLKKHRVPNSKIKKLAPKIFKNQKSLLLHSLTAARHQIYLELIKNTVSKNRQTILLLPDFFDLQQFAGFYIKKLGEKNVAVLCSEATNAQFYQEWQKINTGKAKLIIGSRMAIFAPVKKLGLIIMDDEHNSNYKQWDQNPRYHAREIALKLTELANSKIVLSSPNPTIESIYKIKSKISLSQKEKMPKIVDMRQERQKRNFSIFSDALKDSLIEQINRKKQIILFVPRLGFHTFTLCQDCGYIAECRQCRSALTSRQDGSLICYRCNLPTKMLAKCPACQGARIKSFGIGTQKVKEEIKNIFTSAKHQIKICCLDSETIKNKKSQYKTYGDFIDGKIDILIGAQMVLKNWNLDNLGLIGIVNMESLLRSSDFRSQEKSFQILKQTSLQSQNNAEIIIQAYRPQNKVLQAVLSRDLNKFYQQELVGRKISFGLNYPPFSQIIKLIYQNKNARLSEQNAKKMYWALKRKAAEINAGQFEIMEPFPAFSYQVRGRFRWHIIIKSISKNIYLRDKLLEAVDKYWIIDVDPENLS